ncbi:MAG: synthase subunit epsilon [Rickettsiaceae bacterium]|jgi:F-type H+-transporting ATPase subunit epsilon|nr:synthase subunit epsilon [Rickettsiaceae bacterium]
MTQDLLVEIISPVGYLLNENCHLVTIPAANGEMGVMANHEAVLTSLTEGKIAVLDDKNNILKEFPVKGGFAKTSGNKLIILVD